jgi:S1-C subfamily serine protease
MVNLAANTSFGGGIAKPPTQIYDDILHSVVTLHIRDLNGGESVASGFVVSDSGLVATAWHVVDGAVEIVVRFSDDTEVVASCPAKAGDALHDIALLELERPYGIPVELVRKPARIASRIYVVGAPRGYSFSIVDGLISQLQRIDGYTQYQISCPISPGNSGAPVIDDTGNVVGLVSWSKRGAQNLNFAIPSLHVLNLLESDASVAPAVLAGGGGGHAVEDMELAKAATAGPVAPTAPLGDSGSTRVRDGAPDS